MSSRYETARFQVQAQDAGERLDKLLSQHYPEQSRSYFQSLIARELVQINGSPVKKRVKPREGDEISVEFALTPEISLEPEAIPLNLLYEDQHLLAVNKPPGLVVHPGPGHWSGTFVNALLHHCRELRAEEGDLRPGIVHRLDKDTSGVLIAAKNSQCHQKLVETFAERKIHKQYLAICLGRPQAERIDAPIGRHRVRRKEMTVCSDGKPAHTRLEIVEAGAELSLVKLVIETGRTHQIRVHMKHIGCPILGDPVYGSKSANQRYRCNRQLLHAERLQLEHPITGQPLDLQAPLPGDMEAFIQKIQNDS